MYGNKIFKSIVFLTFFTGLAPTLRADDCTHLWNHTLDINADVPKPMSGDTFAGYALIGWYDDPSIRLEMSGEFLRGRFMSFESYETKKKRHVDVVYDYQIAPNAGSENPFLDGAEMSLPNRKYVVHVLPEGVASSESNILRTDKNARIHSIFYRAYAPSNGVTLKPDELPRINAFNIHTGLPAACPKILDTVFDPGAITALLGVVRRKTELKFRESDFSNGTNYAIPSYVYNFNRKRHGDVSVVKFKAPKFFDTQSGIGPFSQNGDVRYWSLCTQNVKESQTLNCLPDFMAKRDSDDFVTVVIGKGEAVRTAAETRGMNFLEDRRAPSQDIMALFYRNVLPRTGFPTYQGAYLPYGVECSADDFLAEKCHLTRD